MSRNKVLVVDDEPDVEVLFRQQFRRDLRNGCFVMEFALSGDRAIELIRDARDVTLILILSDLNRPGRSGLELLLKARAARLSAWVADRGTTAPTASRCVRSTVGSGTDSTAPVPQCAGKRGLFFWSDDEEPP